MRPSNLATKDIIVSLEASFLLSSSLNVRAMYLSQLGQSSGLIDIVFTITEMMIFSYNQSNQI